jgi:hypothetical protein
MRRTVLVLLAATLVLATPTPGHWPRPLTASVQEMPAPPEFGDVVVDDPLVGTGPFRPGSCPTGRNVGDFAPEGFRSKVTGRCIDADPSASMRPVATGLTVADGEVSVEATVVEGLERARISLSVRLQPNGDAYVILLEPMGGRTELRKALAGVPTTLAERTDLAPRSSGDWTRLALRLDGQRLWAFIDDEPVLSAVDDAIMSGGSIGLGVLRTGNADDDAPVAAVWRNLRVAALASGEAARAPTYAPPTPVARAASFVPAAGTPPPIGRVVHEEALTAPGVLRPGACPTGRGSGEIVDEGFMLKTHGRCVETAPFVSVGPLITGLTVPDGELRIDFRVANGVERAAVNLGLRFRASGTPSGYVFTILPGSGRAGILKTLPGQAPAMLAQRSDLAGILHRDGWNTVAARLLGSSLWLFANDQPALAVDDTAFEVGLALVAVERLGSPDDDQEVTVVFRNLRISSVEGAPEDRAPTYQPTNGPATIGLLRATPDAVTGPAD